MEPAAQIEWHESYMPTEFFEKHPASLRLEMLTVMNEGFQRWDPAPKSADAKAFLAITAEDLSDGAFTTQIAGLTLNGLKDMGKNGIQYVAEPTEKQRAIVNGWFENASRAMVNRLAEKFDPFMQTKGPFNRASGRHRWNVARRTGFGHFGHASNT